MPKKLILLSLTFLLCTNAPAAPKKTTNTTVSETLVAQLDFSSLILESFRISPDGKRVAYITNDATEHRVVTNNQAQEKYDVVVETSLTFSPDRARTANISLT
ncbi:MAG: hypothetical protein ACYSR5_10295 [Planctomycetota bacterium]|jgi:hypothetical protein